MKRNVLTFVNHACFIVQNDSALLLVDPWVEGPVFNNGWSLLDQSTSNAALVARLNQAGLPVYVWYSRGEPDHLSLPFVRHLNAGLRGKATFLYRQTEGKRVAGLLRRHGCDVVECAPGEPVALGHDMRLTVFPFRDGASWGVINCGGRNVLNLNDCSPGTVEQCRALKAQLERVAPRIDLMLTRFGYAYWVGNPGQGALHQAAAREMVNRIALQLAQLRPKIVVPFASFAYFCHPENAYLNEGQNWPRTIAESAQLARLAPVIRFLRPGATVDLDGDTAASLLERHAQAIAHWGALLQAGFRLLPAQAPVPLAEVRAAFLKYRAIATSALHGLPRLLELLRWIAPLAIHLPDLQQTVRCSYRSGFKVLERGAAFDLAMTSATAVLLFSDGDGFEALHAGGRFRTGHDNGLALPRRFFAPQRMLGNGDGRRHPLLVARDLVRDAAARVARQLQAALR